MTIIDNFFPKKIFKNLQDYCNENEFKIVEAGDKKFSVLPVPENLYPYLQLKKHEIIFAFIRNAYRDFDNTERIHCDGIIFNKQTDKAAVVYINDNEGVSENGTKFYSHITHGECLDPMDEDEFNRLILEDSADITKWTETDYVKAQPNRLLRYKANYFHGKWPAKIEEGVRKVLVIFYAKID